MDALVLLSSVVVCLCPLAFALSTVTTTTKTSYACYSSGGDCGFHFLSCDQGLVISIRSMYYGYKDPYSYSGSECSAVLTNCADYAKKTSCCRHDVIRGCLKTYFKEHQAHAKETCDGKTRCSFHATYADGGCQRPPLVYDDVSSYSVISYVCIKATSVPPLTTSAACDDCGGFSEWETTTETTQSSNQHDEGPLPLVVGVSVGVGFGIISLLIIAAICWIRIRRKPPIASPAEQTRNRRLSRRRNVARRASHTPSSTRTVSSSLPSSLYSSSLFTDTLSSRPDSLWEGDSVHPSAIVDRVPHLSDHSDDVDWTTAHSSGKISIISQERAQKRAATLELRSDAHSSASGDSGNVLRNPLERPRNGQSRSENRREQTDELFSLFSLHLNDNRDEPEGHEVDRRVQAASSSPFADRLVKNTPFFATEGQQPSDQHQSALTHPGGTTQQISCVSLEENESSDFQPSTYASVCEEDSHSRDQADVKNITYTISLTSQRRHQWMPTSGIAEEFVVNGHHPEAVYAVPRKMKIRGKHSAPETRGHHSQERSQQSDVRSGSAYREVTNQSHLESPSDHSIKTRHGQGATSSSIKRKRLLNDGKQKGGGIHENVDIVL